MNLPTPLPSTQTGDQAMPFQVVVQRENLELQRVNGPIKRFSFDSTNIENMRRSGYFIFLLQFELEGGKYVLWAYMARYATEEAK